MTLTENKTRGKGYNKMQKTALMLYEKFVDTLDDNQKIMFEEVLDKLFELNEELSKTDFEQGFKLVLNVAVDAFKE